MVKQKWNVGEQVILASGGPKMTVKVQGISDQGSQFEKHWVVCDWFDGDNKRQTAEFHPDQLIKSI
jgi:uncharacterized protein YodC (DUF2158 family)